MKMGCRDVVSWCVFGHWVCMVSGGVVKGGCQHCTKPETHPRPDVHTLPPEADQIKLFFAIGTDILLVVPMAVSMNNV